MGATRYPCMPSLVALQQMRNRLHLAYLGKKLMKWTALATGRELRKIAQDIQMLVPVTLGILVNNRQLIVSVQIRAKGT